MPKAVKWPGQKEMENWGEYIQAGGAVASVLFCFSENAVPLPLPGLLGCLISVFFFFFKKS